jgi:hypothetical protein
VTIPRFVRAIFAFSASPSTSAAGMPLRSLRAEHAAACSPVALEGYRHQLLLRPGRTARTPLRSAACAMLAPRSIRTCFHPILQFNRLLPRAPSQNKFLVTFFLVFAGCFSLASRSLQHIAASRLRVAINLSMKCCCTVKCPVDLHMFVAKKQQNKF